MSSSNKIILLITALLLVNSVNGLAISREDLANGYFVGKTDVPGPFYVAECNVSEDGRTVIFRDAKGDSLRRDNDCLGGFEIVNDIVSVKAHCTSSGENLDFEVNMQNVTKEQLQHGVRVYARGDETNRVWTPFKVQKQSEPFFPKK